MGRTYGASRTTVLGIIAGVVMILRIAQTAGQWMFLVALAASLGTLAWASWRWGGDTRDGRDWAPRN